MTVIYDQMTVVHVQTVTLMLVMDVRDQMGFVASGRSKGVKLDGPNDWKWTVWGQSGRSAKVDGPEIQKWTVLRKKTVRSEEMILNGLNG